MSQALETIFADMSKRFQPGKTPQKTTFYFSLGDRDDQKWILEVGPDACSAKPGKTQTADVVLKTSEELFVKLVRGEWTPGAMDFMRGKIKSNDPMKLALLRDCFGA